MRDRKRKRQREWHRRRRAENPAFRQEQNRRCAEANRRGRAAIRVRAGPHEPSADALLLSYVLTGLLSQLTDTTDPVQIRTCLRDYEARGRRVAVLSCSGTDPP